jgi:hypothetical protein
MPLEVYGWALNIDGYVRDSEENRETCSTAKGGITA